MQETLAKVYDRTRRRFAGAVDNPAAYAQTTLVRTFVSSRRRRSSTERPYAELPDDAGSGGVEAAELRLMVAEALGGLSDIDRAIVVLRYFDDLSVDEVAGRLGLTSGAVRNRCMRALARLRERSLQ